MVIFHSYVSLPEGILFLVGYLTNQLSYQTMDILTSWLKVWYLVILVTHQLWLQNMGCNLFPIEAMDRSRFTSNGPAAAWADGKKKFVQAAMEASRMRCTGRF